MAPGYRGSGVATALLDYICQDAKADGYVIVEAYPFQHNKYHAYHGPLSMYKKNRKIRYFTAKYYLRQKKQLSQ